MARKLHAIDVRDDAAQILAVWEANTNFTMVDVTLADFKGAQSKLGKLIDDIAKKENELGAMRNDRDDEALALNEVCTRARSGMRGYFGPNSTQYEQAGGTRASERKRPQRKPADTPTK